MQNVKSSDSDERIRNWTFLVYPDSAPDNWRDILDLNCVPWIESPCHDSDVDEATGELKKAHYHVMLLFRGKKSFEQVSNLAGSVNGTLVKRVHDTVSLARYFAHMDHPHKFQYNPSDIKAHCGVDLSKYLDRTVSEKHDMLREILAFCSDNDISEYCDLLDYCLSSRPEWFDLLCENYTLVLSTYFKSKYFKSLSKGSSPRSF